MAESDQEVWFDPDYDKELSDTVIRVVQTEYGCFHCGKPEDRNERLLLCSRCKIARYCNKDCQRTHWKADHKQICSIYCENRDDPAGFTVAQNLKGCGLISLQNLEDTMDARRDLFLNELTQSDKRVVLGLAVSVVWQFDCLFLAAEATFWGGDQVHRCNHVLYQVVDKGDEAKRKIQAYPCRLSPEALRRVHDKLVAFAKQVYESNGDIGNFCFGKGLLDQAENKELMARIRATGCKVAMGPMVATNHAFGF